jgi:hypothetical protein
VNGVSLQDHKLIVDVKKVRARLEALCKEKDMVVPDYEMSLQSLESLLSYLAYYVRISDEPSGIIIQGSMETSGQ